MRTKTFCGLALAAAVALGWVTGAAGATPAGAQATTLKAQVQDSHAKLAAAQAQHMALQAQVADLEKQNAARQQQLAQVNARIAALQKQLAAAGAPASAASAGH